MVKKNAPDLSSPSSPRNGSVCVGDDTNDTCSSLEAPRPARPRSEAQIAAFEKARAKRAENLAASAPAAPATAPPAPTADPLPPTTTPPVPATSPPAPAATPKRKTRSDKGGKRGYLVKREEAPFCAEGACPEEYEPPRSGYTNFVIV